MPELVEAMTGARARLELAVRLMNGRDARHNRKQLSRELATAALALADNAVQVAQRAEALAVEVQNLRTRLAAIEGEQIEMEPVI
jgi:hypothetical protein